MKQGCLALAFALASLPYVSAAETSKDPPATVTAGLGKGVTIRAFDDKLTMTTRARIQTRVEYVNEPDPSEEDVRFMVRRARLLFQGNAWGPKLTYYIQFGFSNLDTEPDLRLPLRDMMITWAPIRDLNIRFGQGKVPFGRQRVTSSSSLELVDRSIVIPELSLDRDVGVVFFSRDFLGLHERLGYQLGVWGGDGRNRVAEHEGALFTARLDFWPNGHFEGEYSEADFSRTPKPRIAMGLSAAFNQNSFRARSTIGDTYRLGGFDYAHGAFDVMFKWRGFSAQMEAMLRSSERDSRTGTFEGKPLTEWSRSAGGWFVQLTQMIGPHLQLGARYSRLAPLFRTDPRFRSQHEVGGGVSWYFQEHALKVQADYFHLFFDDPALDRHQVRLQAQLYF